MSAKIIDGEAVAEQIRKQVIADAAALTSAGKTPHLVAVQVGENPASKIYTNMQAKACQAAGIQYELLNLPADMTQAQLLEKIGQLNADAAVSGLILQMPLPPQIDTRVVQVAISPQKDVEGMHPVNMGRLFFGGGIVAPCTPMAAIKLLTETCADLGGKEAVVVGHSEIVGKPIAMILLQSPNASPTVTVCHVATKDLAFHTRRADVLIVAAGVSQAKWMGYQKKVKAEAALPPPDLRPLISGDMVKPGAIVIDVAINRIPKGFDAQGQPLKDDKGKNAMTTVGDVDFQAASQIASAITPVPGGVGPVTVAMLLANTIACAKGNGVEAQIMFQQEKRQVMTMAKSQSKVPYIDAHLHLSDPKKIDKLMAKCQDMGFAQIADASLIQHTTKGLALNATGMLLKAMYPKEAFFMGGIQYLQTGVPIDKVDAAAQARELMEIGCDGMKMLKGKPTTRKNLGLALDSSFYDGYFSYLQEHHVPLVCHVGDPETFWDKDLVPKWAVKYGWFYGDGTYVSKEQLHAETERMLKRYPRLNVWFAHFYFQSNAIDNARRLMEQFPNICFDITPGIEMFYNFSKTPQAWHDFFTQHQDRIIFGTDNTEDEHEEHYPRVAMMRRFLETSDSFEYFGQPVVGIALDKQALEKVYYRNFHRVVGSKPRPLNFPLAIEYCHRQMKRIVGSEHCKQVQEQLQYVLDRLEQIAGEAK